MKRYILCLALLLNSNNLLATKHSMQQIMLESAEEGECDEYDMPCTISDCIWFPYYCCALWVIMVCERETWEL